MFCELWLSRKYLKGSKRERIISITAIISTLGIALGVMVLIVVISVMSGFDRFLEDKMVGTSSHLSLEFYNGLSQPYKVSEELSNQPHILAAAPFISWHAFIKTDKQIFGVEVRGIDPDLQVRTSKIREYLKKGTYNITGNEVILGEELAWRMGLGLGSKISLVSPATLTRTAL